jgi:hypothetical protein
MISTSCVEAAMRPSKREPFYSLSPGLGKRETTPC